MYSTCTCTLLHMACTCIDDHVQLDACQACEDISKCIETWTQAHIHMNTVYIYVHVFIYTIKQNHKSIHCC